MVAEKIIPIEPGSEVERLLDEVDDGPVVAVSRGKRFRIVREPFADYDPEKAREALRDLAGMLKDTDASWPRRE